MPSVRRPAAARRQVLSRVRTPAVREIQWFLPPPVPQSYVRKHLAEKILTPRSALEGEDKPVTVLFADLRGSMELLAEGFMAVTPLGPVPVKGRTAAIELYELTGAPPHRSRLVTAAAPRL
jgi:class 3 adenylate cyclase